MQSILAAKLEINCIKFKSTKCILLAQGLHWHWLACLMCVSHCCPGATYSARFQGEIDRPGGSIHKSSYSARVPDFHRANLHNRPCGSDFALLNCKSAARQSAKFDYSSAGLLGRLRLDVYFSVLPHRGCLPLSSWPS